MPTLLEQFLAYADEKHALGFIEFRIVNKTDKFAFNATLLSKLPIKDPMAEFYWVNLQILGVQGAFDYILQRMREMVYNLLNHVIPKLVSEAKKEEEPEEPEKEIDLLLEELHTVKKRVDNETILKEIAVALYSFELDDNGMLGVYQSVSVI